MPANAFQETLRGGGVFIAMVHVQALPGTPSHRLDLDAIVSQAVAEAALCRDAGVDAVMIENMHDVPYLRDPGPEITAALTRVGTEVRRLGITVGVQVLAGANRAALAVALAAGMDFVRVEGFVYAHIADEGVIEACAGDLLRYRRQIGAERVAILADIKKKHSAHAITADVDLAETARTAAFCGADGIVITGTRTGVAPDPSELQAARAAVDTPILVGSGVTPENLAAFAPWTHAVIVGSALKVSGHWANPVDPERLERLVKAWRRA